MGGEMDYLRQQGGAPSDFFKADHSPEEGEKSPSLYLWTGSL